LTSSPS